MDGRPVLVSTQDEDATADLVIAELNRRRVPVLRLDPGRDFPDSAVLAARLCPDGWGGTLTVAERTADLNAVRAIYHRRPNAYTRRTTRRKRVSPHRRIDVVWVGFSGHCPAVFISAIRRPSHAPNTSPRSWLPRSASALPSPPP